MTDTPVAVPAAGEDRPMIKPLTGMRAVAALWVMMLHFGSIVHWRGPLGYVSAYGPAGVGLFFVLSGFVLTVNYHTWFKSGTGMWRRFARARIARILPVYLVGIAIAGISMGYVVHSYKAQYAAITHVDITAKAILITLPLQLLAIHAWIPSLSLNQLWNAPGWSVSTELGFYALFPLLTYFFVARLPNKRAMIIAWVGLVVVELGGFTALLAIGFHTMSIGHQNTLALALYETPIARLPEFLVGCVAATLYLRMRAEHSPLLGDAGMWLRNGLVLVGGIWVALVIASPKVIAHPPHTLRAVLMLHLGEGPEFLPGFSLVILGLTLGPTFLEPLLNSRPFQALGLASYSLYVIHYAFLLPFMVHVGKTGHYPGVWVPVVLAAGTIAAALALHHFVEVPARRMILRRRTPATAAPT